MTTARKPRSGNQRQEREEKEFDQKIIDLARVTRVMAGGKRMRFRACVMIGDHNGRAGMAVAKGADVTLAVNKAYNKAKKNLVIVPIVNETIPHRVDVKFGAAQIMLKPAPKGTGIKAGGAVRNALDLAGVSNVVAKILGSKNKINNVRATIKALRLLKPAPKKETIKGRVKTEAKTSDKK